MRTFTDWLRNEGFRPKREDIYEEACTHSSYANEHPHGCDNNERLEFMGMQSCRFGAQISCFICSQRCTKGK